MHYNPNNLEQLHNIIDGSDKNKAVVFFCDDNEKNNIKNLITTKLTVFADNIDFIVVDLTIPDNEILGLQYGIFRIPSIVFIGKTNDENNRIYEKKQDIQDLDSFIDNGFNEEIKKIDEKIKKVNDQQE